MDKTVFVAREREINSLGAYLAQAIAGQGLVCFVTGEAGSGKTTLVREFARQAQEKYPDLAVAVGQSDSQTGAGDAHLPFREMLGQLTGDVDSKLAQGVITKENASRLKKLLVLSGQALVDVGPDLIGIFVPGVGLATRVGAFVAEKVGWLERLQALVDKPRDTSAIGDKGIQQSHIFEQYANFLGKLAEKRPLLLILDDLQWADVASIDLLFRLGRRIRGYRILIIGTYRPEEVAIGRSGNRHPLEKVLAEFKRYYGDNRVDLDQAQFLEGQQFVDAYLSTEPNCLQASFRRKLFQHTNGHPLFTVELLRNMQERGDLVQDDQGKWVETDTLHWESLPERVEGVIEERIGRLAEDLRQMLTIGSVEGEDFTAEVLARVQAIETRNLILRLSGELERQHRLIIARGIQRLDETGQRLSLYRFQHNLLQKYLYNELSDAERTYLHQDVGQILEELYDKQADDIAVQLSWHFEEAGIEDKAQHYLQLAGEQAAARFAHEEAVNFYTRSLAAIPLSEGDNNEKQLLIRSYDVYLKREDAYSELGRREAQRCDLNRLAQLATTLGQKDMQAEVLLREARYAELVGDYPSALSCLSKAIVVAQEIEDVEMEARAIRGLGYVLWCKGDYKDALVQSEKALALAQAAGLRQIESLAAHDLTVIHWRLGQPDKGKEYAQKSLEASRHLGNLKTQNMTLNVLGNIELGQANYASAKEYYEKCLRLDLERGNLRGQAMNRGNLGIVAEIEGDLSTALIRFQEIAEIFHEIGDRASEARSWAHLGLNARLQGIYSSGIDWYKQALKLYRDIDNHQGEVWVLTLLGRIHIEVNDLALANEYSNEALRLSKEYGLRGWEALSWSLKGRILELEGDLVEARHAYSKSLEMELEGENTLNVVVDQADLARIALKEADHSTALGYIEQVITYAEQQPIQGTGVENFEIYLTCYQVLKALGDIRARDWLTSTYHLLHERASRISDEAMRQSYLENILSHQEIIIEYERINQSNH